MIWVAFMGATVLGLGLLVFFGGRVERWAALAVIACLVVAPLLEPVKFGHWRLGVAAVELLLFLTFWGLAERTSRGWLTAAAGFQLVAVFTFVAPIFTDTFVWSGVMARYGVWGLITTTFFAGALECWAVRRLRQEAIHENELRSRRRPVAAPVSQPVRGRSGHTRTG